MPGGRIPGTIGTDGHARESIDHGTSARTRSPTPIPLGRGSRVASMTLKERFVEVLRRTLPRLPRQMQAEVAGLFTPRGLEIMAGVLAAWGVGHFFGYGEAVDVVLAVAGYALLGAQAFSAGADLVRAIRATVDAEDDADLDRAARWMAGFVATVGVAGMTALFFKGASKARGVITGAVADSRFGGIAAQHVQAFQQAARETGQVIGVRFTNFKSTPWIEKGFPPKPLDISKIGLKTDKATGFVRALTPAEVEGARSLGYYVVGEDGLARGVPGPGGVRKVLELPEGEWPIAPGQVIHPKQVRPLVGDYDLLGVIEPKAPGRNLALAASDGGKGGGAKALGDWSNPVTRRVAQAINARLDQPRIMHGAHDARFVLPSKADEGAIFFFPDGEIRRFKTASEVEAFYRSIGRKPVGAPEKLGE